MLIQELRGRNSIRGLEAFIEAWSNEIPYPENIKEARLARSKYGNLNAGGIPAGLYAPALSKWHPRFLSCIEYRVQPLVGALTDIAGLMTYTSCEGHAYPSTLGGGVELHVGVLPRNQREYLEVKELLWSLVRSRTEGQSSAAYPTVAHGHLQDEDSSRSVEVLDLYVLRRTGTSWEKYFAALELETNALVQELRNILSEK